jgi:hypothetical protein
MKLSACSSIVQGGVKWLAGGITRSQSPLYQEHLAQQQ